MKYLVDTHIFLWSLSDDKKLNNSIKEILKDPQNLIYVSVISAWELSIKLKTNPDFKIKTSIKKAFTISGFEILPISFEHSLQIQKLPLYHKDPFDRMLIAQATVENLTLITIDPQIKKYSVKIFKS